MTLVAFHWCQRPLFVLHIRNGTIISSRSWRSQVILWDKVIESADEAHLIEEDVTIKYSLIDEVS